LIFKKN